MGEAKQTDETCNAALAWDNNGFNVLPARDDWQLRFSADGYESRVVAVGFVNPGHAPPGASDAKLAVPLPARH